MSDPLTVQIGYRLKFVDDPVSRRLLVKARDRLLEVGEGGLDAQQVANWLASRDPPIRLVKWQVDRFRAEGVEVDW